MDRGRIRVTAAALPNAFPHPTARRAAARAAVVLRLRPAPARAADAHRRERVLRAVLCALVFYLLTAALIVAGVALHEYSHYAAHEGLSVPEVAYAGSVGQAQRDLLEVQRSRGPGGEEVLLQQPRATTIVFFPNTFLQAAALGLLPSEAYQDDGVLASTFFHLDGGQVDGMRSRGGQMPDAVIAAPLWAAIATFVLAFLWTLLRPSLPSKALLVAGAVHLGNAGHHAGALGIPPGAFYVLTTLAVILAAVAVGLRAVLPRRRAPSPARPHPARPDLRPATRIVVAAPSWPPGRALSVRAATDKPSTRPPGKRLPVRPPVTLP